MKARALVIGSGWGAHAADALSANGDVELAGIVGRGSERTQRLARRHSVPVFTDVAAAVARTRPALAVVAVGERSNAAVAAALVDAGVDVLCAHPVAQDEGGVLDLASRARSRGRSVIVDYTFRAAPALAAVRERLGSLGATLRIGVQSPGRALPIALDLAVHLAGPVAEVFSAPEYPPQLDERRRRSPESFPPAVLLTHLTGTVTAILAVPHAAAEEAHRVTVSTERGRIDLVLPAGHACLVRASRAGSASVTELCAPACAHGPEVFGSLFRELVITWAKAPAAPSPSSATLEDEAHLRAVWRSIEASCQTGERMLVTIRGGATRA